MAGYRVLIERSLGARDEPPEPGLVDSLTAWAEAVSSWNRRMDLTAARSDEELIDLLLADAVTLADWLPRSNASQLVDVGAGAGAPGLPLALLRGDLQVTLVEPMQKRAAFLRMVLGRLAVEGRLPASVLQQRGEQVRGQQCFDVALSRATLPPPAWLELGAALAPAGRVVVLLAREGPPELAGWEQEASCDYRWPLTGAERVLVRYRPLAPA